jgi:hypothetical protein
MHNITLITHVYFDGGDDDVWPTMRPTKEENCGSNRIELEGEC